MSVFDVLCAKLTCASLRQLSLQEQTSSLQNGYTWSQSPAQASLQGRMSTESEQIEFDQLDSYSFSDELLASGQSSTSCADLCCGESDVLHERQLFRSMTEHSRSSCEPAAKAQLQRTHSAPAPQTPNPTFGVGQHDVLEMIRYCCFGYYDFLTVLLKMHS